MKGGWQWAPRKKLGSVGHPSLTGLESVGVALRYDVTVLRFGFLTCEIGTIMVPLMVGVRRKRITNVLSPDAENTPSPAGIQVHPVQSHYLEGTLPRTTPRASPL